VPRGAAQAKGLLLSCIEEPDPCIMFEPKILYRKAIDQVPKARYKIEIGKGETVREGKNSLVRIKLRYSRELCVFPICEKWQKLNAKYYDSRIVKAVCIIGAIPSPREYNLSNAIPPIIQLPKRNDVFADDRSRSGMHAKRNAERVSAFIGVGAITRP